MSIDILLMDDDSAAHLIYERLIQDEFGPSVRLDHCRDENLLGETLSTKRYAILILDQRLSNGTLGLQLVPTIRKVSPGTRIVLNSAFSDEKLAVEAIDVGVDAYVLGRKQDDEELLRILKREIDGLQRLNSITAKVIGDTNSDIKHECKKLAQSLQKKVSDITERKSVLS